MAHITVTMAEGASNMVQLPPDLLLNIFTFLDYKDLICCNKLNKKFHHLSSHNCLWKPLCKKYWLVTECPPGMSWKNQFCHWYQEWGCYIHCYCAIKGAWDKIMKFMVVNCPTIYSSVKCGLCEQEVRDIEENVSIKLPKDLKCSYRIHNGQKLNAPGLMGSMSIHSHYRTESLLDLETASIGFQQRDGLKGCLPLTICLHSGLTQFIALNDLDGYQPNIVFYPSQDLILQTSGSVDAFISGRSFTEWFVNYAELLDNGHFGVLNEQPYKFYKEPGCESTTRNITVTAETCFLPELSSVNPPHFFHTYRIVMSMGKDVSTLESCQLVSRHWIVTDENGHEERINGPGVVGEFPIIKPGTSYSWVSCTNFNTTYGNMRGHFTMKNLITGLTTDIMCPIYHMKCFPYVTAEERIRVKLKKE
ncbi:F-box only protein 3-like isoform X2 [Tachypleus tridentatus]|uniref:F-box only protein 3-like isoform X2 n=1 Tax=Tachypleus tridentatus TaxID=6853 RepID=UPI003FD5EB27